MRSIGLFCRRWTLLALGEVDYRFMKVESFVEPKFTLRHLKMK